MNKGVGRKRAAFSACWACRRANRLNFGAPPRRGHFPIRSSDCCTQNEGFCPVMDCDYKLQSLSLRGPPDSDRVSEFSSFPDDLSDSSDSETQQAKARRYSGTYQAPSPVKPAAAAPLADSCPRPGWAPADSAALYNVAGWGAGYVQVNDETGHLEVLPQAGAPRRAGGPPAARRRRQPRVHASAPAAAGPTPPLLLMHPLAGCCWFHRCRRGRPRRRPARAGGAAARARPAHAYALPLPAHRGSPHRQAERAPHW